MRNDGVRHSKFGTVENCGEIWENQIQITFIRTGALRNLFVRGTLQLWICYNQAKLLFQTKACNYYSYLLGK